MFATCGKDDQVDLLVARPERDLLGGLAIDDLGLDAPAAGTMTLGKPVEIIEGLAAADLPFDGILRQGVGRRRLDDPKQRERGVERGRHGQGVRDDPLVRL
jgi:hypothetical protein